MTLWAMPCEIRGMSPFELPSSNSFFAAHSRRAFAVAFCTPARNGLRLSWWWIVVELIVLAAGSACSSACTQHIRNDDIDASIRTVPGPAATMVRMSWDSSAEWHCIRAGSGQRHGLFAALRGALVGLGLVLALCRTAPSLWMPPSPFDFSPVHAGR